MKSTLIVWIALLCLKYTHARVNIINTFRPMYVQYGSNLTLTCVSDNRRKLRWLQEIKDTDWKPEVITPVLGGNTITRYLVEEPSGQVESTLIKSDITLNDRGMYQCQDEDAKNSFALWATVLYIQKVNEVASPSDSVDLSCTLLGFETNIPYIDYHWYYKDQRIVQGHPRYDLVHRDGVSQLTIDKPTRADHGEYQCSFTLQTNIQPITFTATVELDASNLPSAASTILSKPGLSYMTFVMATILVVAMQHILE